MHALKKDIKSPFSIFRLSLLIITGLVFLLPHHSAQAATMSLSASNASVEVGGIFTIRIRVNSPSDAINAVSGVLNFQNNSVQLLSLSKSSSIVGLWVKEPAYSNSFGTANFEGVILNPGFTGDGGTVLNAQFKALKVGVATFTLTEGQTLANDGNGTDLFTAAFPASVTIGPATDKPKPTQPETAKPVESVALEAPFIASPIITLKYGESGKIEVTSKHPGARIRLTLAPIHSGSTQADDSQALNFDNPTGSDGKVLFTLPSDLPLGMYEISTVVFDGDGNTSPPFDELLLVSEGGGWGGVQSLLTSAGAGFIITIIILLLILSLISTYARYRLHIYEKNHPKGTMVVSRELLRLKEDLEAMVRDFQKEKEKRKLTVLENKYLKRMRQYTDLGE